MNDKRQKIPMDLNQIDDNTPFGKVMFFFSMLSLSITFTGVEIALKLVALGVGIVGSIITARYYWIKTKQLKDGSNERKD